MAESPPGGGGPNGDQAEGQPKKGSSDALFNPPGLKTRKTVMGLAPAPHLGGADRTVATAASEAEARKQRVLARIAAGGRPPERMETGPPPPQTVTQPPAAGRYQERYTGPPPAAEPEPQRTTQNTNENPLHRKLIEETYIGPPAFGQTTTIISTPVVPLTLPRTVSSDGKLPAASGWDVHENAKDAEIVETTEMEAAPNTARMLRPATPVDAVPPAALAVRAYEPAYAPRPFTGPLDRRLTLLTEPHSPRAASFRILRDGLIAKNMPRVLAVTSPSQNDGKTTCAANLSLALAEQSSRVLLIDGNYFGPDLARMFGIERLASATPPDAAAWLAPYKIVEITPTLHAAGIVQSASEPLPRFDQQRFDAMIDRLVRVAYDYIIIDTPAMRGTPAVMQLLATADATLLVVRSGETTTRDLRRAADQIPRNKALGIALIDALPFT